MFRMYVGPEECGGRVVVELRGELDLMDAADVAAALIVVAARQPRIIVDLAGLEFIDASGIAALSRGREHARDTGGDLLLAAPQRPVRRVLAIIWEADGFGVYPSVAAAASAGAAQRPPIPVKPENSFISGLAGADSRNMKHQKETSSKLRWQRCAVHAAAPKQLAFTGAWLPRGSWTRRFRPPADGDISG